MKIVLLSGGSGQRLWPMSNESRSKQFLKVLPNGKSGSISMLQRVWGQLTSTGLAAQTFVCASKSQQEMIFHQIGEIPFIEEPFRKDTFPAISLSVLFLLDKVHVASNEPIVVLPVDHFVDNHYFEQVAQLSDILADSHAELVLMGARPEAPTSKFGYISVEPLETNAVYRKVDKFVEKPERGLATRLIREGALWNCGVFCFRGQTILDFLRDHDYPTSYEMFRKEFSNLPKKSFDYEMVEKAESVVVYPYEGTWNDIGTWSALCAHMDSDIAGSGTNYECCNTHVINELGIPVVALGLQNAIVVATPDGILAADKGHSAMLKNAIRKYNGRPMYEERRWGTYRVLDYQKLEDGTEVLTKCIELFPESNISYQKHFKRSEIWTIIEGNGHMALDGRIFPVSPGDVVRIYAEQWHAIRAANKLKFIEVQRGSELVEEDIVRRYLTWDEVETVCSFGVNRK